MIRSLRKSTARFLRPRPAGVIGTSALTWPASTTDSEGGVFGVVPAANATQRFEFSEVAPRVGVPIDLEISESSVLKLVVTFPSDYAGQGYIYTATTGAVNVGTFPAAHSSVNY